MTSWFKGKLPQVANRTSVAVGASRAADNTRSHSQNTHNNSGPSLTEMKSDLKPTDPALKNTSRETGSSVYVSNIPERKNGSCLLLIDPQNDFVAVDGALSVPGAKEDCERIAKFIERNKEELQEIYVTLDTHMLHHIAHPNYWKVAATGEHPKHFERITHKDVLEKKYIPTDKKLATWVVSYTKDLEESSDGRFVLTIWPPHCLVGSNGHNVDPKVYQQLRAWEQHHNRCVHYIIKGNNSKTEHYSAFRAEVVVKEDPATYFNVQLINELKAHNKIYVAGEAKSHCVNFSVRDLVSVQGLGAEEAAKKVVLLNGGMSDVFGCKDMGDKFWSDIVLDMKIAAENIDECKVLGEIDPAERDAAEAKLKAKLAKDDKWENVKATGVAVETASHAVTPKL